MGCDGSAWVSLTGGSGSMDYSPTTSGLSWSSIFLSGSGGSGSISPVGTLSNIGGYNCGPLATITLAATGLTNSTQAAIVSFYTADGGDNGPAARVFTTGSVFVGGIGQAGRGGDGESHGAAGELIIPLTNRQFRIQSCRGNSSSATWRYAVKAILN